MNEQIKTILRIVKPPGYIPLGYYTPQGSFNSWGMSDEELQKFAELIIEECTNLDFSEVDYISIEGEEQIRDLIRKHFGLYVGPED